jgi:hypothetical protein
MSCFIGDLNGDFLGGLNWTSLLVTPLESQFESENFSPSFTGTLIDLFSFWDLDIDFGFFLGGDFFRVSYPLAESYPSDPILSPFKSSQILVTSFGLGLFLPDVLSAFFLHFCVAGLHLFFF